MARHNPPIENKKEDGYSSLSEYSPEKKFEQVMRELRQGGRHGVGQILKNQNKLQLELAYLGLAQIAELSVNGKTENTRLKSSMWLYEQQFGKVGERQAVAPEIEIPVISISDAIKSQLEEEDEEKDQE